MTQTHDETHPRRYVPDFAEHLCTADRLLLHAKQMLAENKWHVAEVALEQCERELRAARDWAVQRQKAAS